MASRSKPNSENQNANGLFPDESAADQTKPNLDAPLAGRMRPRSIDEIIGQEHLLAPGKLLRRTIQSERWSSMMFYGPPGSGKTTLARVISKETSSLFVPLNAVTSNAAELREVLSLAKKNRSVRKKTILFLDEIHRFNKAQQDILMPDVESGNIILIGATTHNPSFAINGPLLSRSIVFELKPLEETHLIQILKLALNDSERGLGKYSVQISEAALIHLAKMASGDARRALNALEIGVLTTPADEKGLIHFDIGVAEESSQRRVVYYDTDEDYHYDTASAFIKSMRGSDPDAAIFWLAKMLYAGEDPRFIVRRILILASEDIGNADPHALMIAAAGLQAIEFVGMPESQIILAQLVTYMSMAPKSNASYAAISEAMKDVKAEKSLEVPPHLRDSHYVGAKKMEHGVGYVYPHDGKGAVKVKQSYFDSAKKYYHPADSGLEKKISEKLAALRQARFPLS